jgi:single-stranded DNA-binding protein
MIDSLIIGRLMNKPSERIAQDGKHRFTVTRVKVASADAEVMFCSVIAFAAEAQRALQAADDGDSIALAGTLRVSVWTDAKGLSRPQLDLVAQRVMTIYEVQHKRKAAKPDGETPPKETPAHATSSGRPTITRPKRAESAATRKASSTPAGDAAPFIDEPF